MNLTIGNTSAATSTDVCVNNTSASASTTVAYFSTTHMHSWIHVFGSLPDLIWSWSDYTRIDLPAHELTVHGRIKGKLKIKLKIEIERKLKFVPRHFDKRSRMGFQGIHGNFRRG